jgi:FtsP/CotA-like multicopper oxidase with cupredoxin domain
MHHHFDLSTAAASTDPFYSDTNPFIPEEADQSILLYTRTEKLAKFSNHPKGFINRTSWSPQPQPVIFLPRTKWDENQLIPYIPLPNTGPVWVDIIINNLDDGSHPFHLHGHEFYVIASSRSEHGWGSYSPFKNPKPQYNLVNPLRKDTVSVPRRGYVVIRFKADNPGIWMMHCHVLFHQGSGMAMGIQAGGDEGHEVVDQNAKQLCPS